MSLGDLQWRYSWQRASLSLHTRRAAGSAKTDASKGAQGDGNGDIPCAIVHSLVPATKLEFFHPQLWRAAAWSGTIIYSLRPMRRGQV